MALRPPYRLLSVCLLAALPSAAQAQKLVYVAVNPCRIVDTRASAAGPLTPAVARPFNVVGSTADFPAQGGTAGGCGIPGFAGPTPQVAAVVFNLVAVNPQGAGDLRAWATDQAVPNASVLNYAQVPGLNIANGLVIPVRQDTAGDDLTVMADVSTTQLVIDVVGYFKPLVVSTADLPVVPIEKGGTGSTVKDFVDLSTSQVVGGSKTFAGAVQANAGLTANAATVTGTLTTGALSSGSASVTGTLTTGSPALVPVVGNDANQRIIRGVVTGSTCLIQAGTGFTCTRNSAGNYTLMFTPPFSGNPVPVVMPLLTTLVSGASINGTAFNFSTVNPAGAATDSVFAFIIIGPC